MAQSKADATKARADLENCTTRLSKVEVALQLAKAALEFSRKQFLKSAKAAEDPLH